MNTYSAARCPWVDPVPDCEMTQWHQWESKVIWLGWDVSSVRYSICSGTMSGLYMCVCVCVCVCVCACVCLHWCSRFSTLRHQSWHLQIGVSSRFGRVICAPVLIYFREWIGCMVNEHYGYGFQASYCFLCAVAAPEVNVVHICVSSSSFCVLISLIWDQSHCL